MPSTNEFDYYLGNVNGKKDALFSMGFPVSKEKENGPSVHTCVHVVAQTSGVVAGGGGGGRGGSRPPSDNFLGALKSKRGAKIRNSNVKYYTKYAKSSLSTNSKILKHLMARVQTAFY